MIYLVITNINVKNDLKNQTRNNPTMKNILILITLLLSITFTSVNAVTTIEVSMEKKVTGLYVAFFNRAPDQKGLTYWVGLGEAAQAEGENVSDVLKQLSAKFATHPTFIGLYDGMENRTFVEAIYQNALGKAGNESGIIYWTSRLDTDLSRSDMVSIFIETSLTKPATEENYPDLSAEDLAAAQDRQAFLGNKNTVSLAFTHQMGELSNVVSRDPEVYKYEPAYLASIKIISEVTEDPETEADAIAFLDSIINSDAPITLINEAVQIGGYTIAPVITLNGTNPVTVIQGEVYIDAGATAQDDEDAEIAISTTGSVDTSTVGTYTLTYTATDSSNNSTSETRTINVETAPEFILTSTDISNDEYMDVKFGASSYYSGDTRGENISPMLTWNSIPGTKSYALEMIDLDAPSVHWAIINIPSSTIELPQGVENTFQGMESLPSDYADSMAGTTVGYVGPFPPSTHRYKITVYAVSDTTVLSMSDAKSKAINNTSITVKFNW